MQDYRRLLVWKKAHALALAEFARFLDISIKSAGELEYHLQLAHDYGLIPRVPWQSLTCDATEVRRMLIGLRRSVLSTTAH